MELKHHSAQYVDGRFDVEETQVKSDIGEADAVGELRDERVGDLSCRTRYAHGQLFLIHLASYIFSTAIE